MLLKQFYNIDSKVSSRKSATTFGDLPDWYAAIERECLPQFVKTHEMSPSLVVALAKIKGPTHMAEGGPCLRNRSPTPTPLTLQVQIEKKGKK